MDQYAALVRSKDRQPVRYLIVDGDYITGQTLNINGGIFMM